MLNTDVTIDVFMGVELYESVTDIDSNVCLSNTTAMICK